MKIDIDVNRLGELIQMLYKYPLGCTICPARKDGVKCPFNCEDDHWLCTTALWRWLKGEQLK